MSDMRTVPDHISRPDYANHPDGFPASERAIRSSTSIQVGVCNNMKSLNISELICLSVLFFETKFQYVNVGCLVFKQHI